MHKSHEQQIGISNNPIHRLSVHRRDGWSLIEIRGPGYGRNVLHYEKCIKSWLREEIGLVEGRRENWSTIDLEINSIAELAKISGTEDQLTLLE